MKVYLIRHGVTQQALDGISQTDDVPLAEDAIKENPYKNLVFDKVFSSPLFRAKQTAEKLFGDYEIVDYIYEFRAPKELVGISKDIVNKFWREHWDEVRKDPDWKFNDCESFNEIVDRADKFYKFLKTLDYGRIAVVGHALFFKHLLSIHALGRKNYTIDKYYNLSAYIRPMPLSFLKMEL